MKVIKENIWKFQSHSSYIIVPTNGTINKRGECVMGAGLAKQVKFQYPELPYLIGSKIDQFGNNVYSCHTYGLITFPVKHNWFEKADLQLIEKSAIQLQTVLRTLNPAIGIYMPKVGCGNGGLNWKDVEPIIEKYLPEVIIVDYK